MSSYSEEANRDRKYRELKRSFKHGKVCATCNKYKAGLMTIDHIIPMWQFIGSYSDTSNWQVLCEHCHRIKTREEGFGVGYIHEYLDEETITTTDKTPNPKWYSLRELIDATRLSLVDIYMPTENYRKYLLDEWDHSEKQKKTVNDLKYNNPKLKSLLATKGAHSPTAKKLTAAYVAIEKGNPLSSLIQDDDSYLLLDADTNDQSFTKLERKERYYALLHFLNCPDAPYRMSVFPGGVPDSIADHAIYLTQHSGEDKKRIPGIAILGNVYAVEISAMNATVEVIYNPETLKFAFSYKS